MVCIIWLLNKYFILGEFHIPSYAFWSGVFGSIIALLLKGKNTYKEVIIIKNKKYI
jgi:hypothetical protein